MPAPFTQKFSVRLLSNSIFLSRIAALFIVCSSASVQSQNPFITTWQVAASDLTITIPTNPGLTYDYNVDWGDGNNSANVTGNISHTYSSANTYTVSISGTFPSIYFFDLDATNRAKIRTVQQWGDIAWTSMFRAFFGCVNLTVPATDAPDLSNVTDCSFMFVDASSFNQPINHWDVSTITNMSAMFRRTPFNQPLNNWDVSNVTNMASMFFQNTAFNQDITGWDVSSVTNMGGTFSGTTAFNQPIGAWNVSNVSSFNNTFTNAQSFNQSLSEWDISSATQMIQMFDASGMSTANYDATLNGWVSLTAGEAQIPTGVTLGADGRTYSCDSRVAHFVLDNDFEWTFVGDGISCSPFATTWTTTDGQITIPTFSGESYDYDVFWFNQTNPGTAEGYVGGATGDYTITGLENGSVYRVEISRTFPRIYFNDSGDKNKILTIEQWGSIAWTSMANAFMGCGELTLGSPGFPDLSNVTDMSYMFANTSKMNGDLSGFQFVTWDVSSVTNMSHTFYQAIAFNQPLIFWDISQVTDMTDMLSGSSLSTQAYDETLSGWSEKTGPESQVPTGITLGADGLTFCEGKDARQTLIDEYGWVFIGDGAATDVDPVPDLYYLPALSSEEAITSLIPPTAKAQCGTVTVEGVTDAVLPITETTTITWTYTDEFNNQATQEQLVFIGRPFITRWQTFNFDDIGAVQLPLNNDYLEEYNFSVDWGDGSVDETAYTAEWIYDNGTYPFHIYSEPGTYTIAISGAFPAQNYFEVIEPDMLQSIEQWGDIEWKSMEFAFLGAFNATNNATDAPNLTNVSNLSYMFSGASSINANFGNWNISTITNMEGMLDNTGLSVKNYTQTLNSWATQTGISESVVLGA
ncbi:MAG: BspA family leucine-rich repeat surface protein, partial [Bacteroidota bacterium]